MEKMGRYSGKTSPTSKQSKISYLLSAPFPEEEVIWNTTKDQVLRFVNKGIGRPYTISKNIQSVATGRNIAVSTIRQHLEELEKKGFVYKPNIGGDSHGSAYQITDKGIFLIEKCVGFPVKLSRSRQLRHKELDTYPCRGHGYIFAAKPDKKLSADDWKKILDNLGIKWKPVTFANIPSFKHNNKTIWLGNKQITVRFKKGESYLDKTPIKSMSLARKDLFVDMESLMERLGISFTYRFKCKNKHNGFIDNEQARSFKKQGKTVIISDEQGEWKRFDFSQTKFVEAEITRDDEDLNVATAFQKFENMNKKDGFITARPDNLKKKFGEIDENILETNERVRKVSEKGLQMSQVMEQLDSRFRQSEKRDVEFMKRIIKIEEKL